MKRPVGRPPGSTSKNREKVPVVAKADNPFEIMNNLETIFLGAFLQEEEDEDAVEDENFITVQVKSGITITISTCI